MSKKHFFAILILICLQFSSIIVYASDVSLSTIADSFNSCETVKTYKQYNYDWKAEAKGNDLLITLDTDTSNTTVDFKLEENILNCSISNDESFTGLFATSMLVDSIGQLYGYKDGELFDTLNSEQIREYTVDNEGFEIKETNDGRYSVRIDISKKIPLADFSNVYVELKDIDEFLLDILLSDDSGSFYASKGEITYKVENYDNLVIYIAEKNELTNRTYKSILSFIEATFENENAVKYFTSNFTNISEGNKAFDGFEIVLNLSDEDLTGFKDNYKALKLIIDKEKVKEMLDSGDNQTNNTNSGDRFTDVKPNDWFYDNINYVAEKGLFNGVTETTFGPNMNITRGMLVTVLYRLSGATETSKSDFDDVDKDMYYSSPIAWASKNEYVNGVGNNKFNPNDNITREDLATILYRYVKAQGKGFTGAWMFLLEYEDRNEIADYAYEPICWLTMNGIMTGKDGNKIEPKGLATRAETAKMVQMVAELKKT